MRSESDSEVGGEDSTPIGIDEIESYLRCPRRFEYDHRREIHTATDADAVASRDDRYRTAIAAALDRDGAPSRTRLLEAALGALEDRSSETALGRRPGDARRRYDESTARNAIAAYVEADGGRHAESAVAVDETRTYSIDGYRVSCPTDLVRECEGGYEIVRFVTTLDGIVWANPYRDPVAAYREREGFYPREVGSVLRAYATTHAVAASRGVDAAAVRFRYYAIAQETHPNPDTGEPAVTPRSRDVTESCWEAEDAAEALLAETAAAIDSADSLEIDRWDDVVDTSCPRCPYRRLCLDYVNHEVRFR